MRAGALAIRVEIDRLLDDAGGEVASAIHKAGADRWALHMDARGRALRYSGQLALLEAAPSVFAASLWFEALKEMMSNARVYIVGRGVEDVHVIYDLKDPDSSIDQFMEAVTQSEEY